MKVTTARCHSLPLSMAGFASRIPKIPTGLITGALVLGGVAYGAKESMYTGLR